jgi:GMP synthase-like glutamine amidotransferase
MKEFLLLAAEGAPGTSTLLEVLRSRNRPVRTLTPEELQRKRSGNGERIRALVVLSPPDAAGSGAVDRVAGLVRGCHAAEVPILGMGDGAQTVAGALAGSPLDLPVGTAILAVRPGQAVEDDVVFAAIPEGFRWLLSPAPLPDLPGEAVVMAEDSQGRVAAARFGKTTYSVRMHCTYDRTETVATLAAAGVEADVEQYARFMIGHGISLFGRWVDAAVGRTDEEMPWGRRGPNPVPGPGLFLNPSSDGAPSGDRAHR